jgi:hypothetical protein
MLERLVLTKTQIDEWEGGEEKRWKEKRWGVVL